MLIDIGTVKINKNDKKIKVTFMVQQISIIYSI